MHLTSIASSKFVESHPSSRSDRSDNAIASFTAPLPLPSRRHCRADAAVVTAPLPAPPSCDRCHSPALPAPPPAAGRRCSRG
ncbi:hypothetical protein Scep_018860 [Stephania cephalantha]|uniref:Uncharacterized protein n=1 Tax=Stephania cephalantha TaxID=152367 RepID=A0AAP0NP91_9MAGN